MLKKEINFQTNGLELKFVYNSIYIKVQNNKIINRRNKKSYLIFEKEFTNLANFEIPSDNLEMPFYAKSHKVKHLIEPGNSYDFNGETKFFIELAEKQAIDIELLTKYFENIKFTSGPELAYCNTHPHNNTGDFTVYVITNAEKRYELLKVAIASVEKQIKTDFQVKIKVVYNGGNKNYEEKLLNTLECEVLSLSNSDVMYARKFAVENCDTKYITFLDDDDYIDEMYIIEADKYLYDDVDFVLTRLVDVNEEKKVNYDTYINKVVAGINNGKGYADKPEEFLHSAFNTISAKVYKLEFLKNCDFEVGKMRDTEDVIFWAKNFDNITGRIASVDIFSSSIYYRLLSNDSLSRPSKEEEFNFYIHGRLNVITQLEEFFFSPKYSIESKRIIVTKLTSQFNVLYTYFEKLDIEDKGKIIEIIKSANLEFANVAKFSNIKGLAICGNFAPYIDASAIMATKRLKEISLDYTAGVKWDVVSHEMDNCREIDMDFYRFYARNLIDSHQKVKGNFYFNDKAQFQMGEKLFEKIKNNDYEVIYSRSVSIASHFAAYRYKLKNPSVKWIAEFSDPVVMNINNEVRETNGLYSLGKYKKMPLTNLAEKVVLENADEVLFTNPSQLKYMLDYNGIPTQENFIIKKHCRLDSKYKNVYRSDFELDESKINIAYFGSLYENRNLATINDIASDESRNIYLFTNSKVNLSSNNIFVKEQVSLFEMLNICAKMDYLYLEDTSFNGDINPYIPSKIQDYITAGTPILCEIEKNSELSKLKEPLLIKFEKGNFGTINLQKKIVD